MTFVSKNNNPRYLKLKKKTKRYIYKNVIEFYINRYIRYLLFYQDKKKH